MYLFGINNEYLMKNRIQVTNHFLGCFENVNNQNFFFETSSNKAYIIWIIFCLANSILVFKNLNEIFNKYLKRDNSCYFYKWHSLKTIFCF